MQKKVVLGFIVLAFVMAGIVFGMGVVPQSDYKVYKNDGLGYSFKYPKEWYLNRYDKMGFSYYILSNRESRLSKPLSGGEVVEIEIYETRLPDRGARTNEDIIKKISKELKSTKYFKEISIEGGTLYLVRGSTVLIKDADFGYIYLVDSKAENGERSNYLIEFSPVEVSEKFGNEYLQLLRSIEIFNK